MVNLASGVSIGQSSFRYDYNGKAKYRNPPHLPQIMGKATFYIDLYREERWPSVRASDSGVRGRDFETYLHRVLSLCKIYLLPPKSFETIQLPKRTLAIRTTVVPIRFLIRTTVVPIMILIRTTVVPIRILIRTTGINNALC